MKRKVCIAFAMIIAVVLSLLAVYVLLPKNAVPSESKTWHTLDFVYGKTGSYDSGLFSISNPWRIEWHVTKRLGNFDVPGTFGFGVMTKFEFEWHPIAFQDDVRPIDDGFLYVNESGIFYLQIIANDWVHWELEVQEYS